MLPALLVALAPAFLHIRPKTLLRVHPLLIQLGQLLVHGLQDIHFYIAQIEPRATRGRKAPEIVRRPAGLPALAWLLLFRRGRALLLRIAPVLVVLVAGGLAILDRFRSLPGVRVLGMELRVVALAGVCAVWLLRLELIGALGGLGALFLGLFLLREGDVVAHC